MAMRHLTHTVLLVILVLILASQEVNAEEGSTDNKRHQECDDEIAAMQERVVRHLGHLLRQIIYFFWYQPVNIAIFSVINSDVIVGGFNYVVSFLM